MIVKFVKRNSPYQTGEIAGFTDAIGAALADAGKAVECDKDGKPKSLTPEPDSGGDKKPSAK